MMSLALLPSDPKLLRFYYGGGDSSPIMHCSDEFVGPDGERARRSMARFLMAGVMGVSIWICDPVSLSRRCLAKEREFVIAKTQHRFGAPMPLVVIS